MWWDTDENILNSSKISDSKAPFPCLSSIFDSKFAFRRQIGWERVNVKVRKRLMFSINFLILFLSTISTSNLEFWSPVSLSPVLVLLPEISQNFNLNSVDIVATLPPTFPQTFISSFICRLSFPNYSNHVTLKRWKLSGGEIVVISFHCCYEHSTRCVVIHITYEKYYSYFFLFYGNLHIMEWIKLALAYEKKS